MTTMLQIRDLSKSFGHIEALHGISMDIPYGSVYALLGPNGSGKTTLLKALIGSVKCDSGSICLDPSTDISSRAYKKRIVYMPQFPGFPEHLSGREIIALLIHLRRKAAPHAERLIRDLEIDKFWDKPIRGLSGGMKQKMNILQCLMFDFDIAFLDEPTSSLDPQVAWYLKRTISEYRDIGKTIVFTSHIMSEVEELADIMALISNGRVLLETKPGNFVAEQKADHLEEAMLHFWNEHGAAFSPSGDTSDIWRSEE